MGSKEARHKKHKKNKKKEISNSDPSLTVAENHGKSGSTGKLIGDARFAAALSDPRFQNVPKRQSKVEIDSRFDRVFKDKRFLPSSTPLDKRGRPNKLKTKKNSLRHYYEVKKESEDDEEEEGETEEGVGEEGETEEEGGGEEEEKEVRGKVRSEEDDEIKGKIKKSDEMDIDSESSGSDEDSETDDLVSNTDTDEDIDFNVYDGDFPEVLEEDVPQVEEATNRLAVVNMDWKYIKACDLYALLQSFVPKNGLIKSVAVYPSEFGLLRMKEEETRGPAFLYEDDDKNGVEDGSDEEILNEKWRAYERDRLKYYFAVVECDSTTTADCLYNTCDGTELEGSSNKLDLRFIPDSMEFKHPPRDTANEVPADYEGLNFYTPALQQSKVLPSWDEDEPHRMRTLKRKFNANQLDELEWKEFLASDESESDGSEDEDDNEDKPDKKDKKREKYLSLIQSGDGLEGDEESAQGMEVTFNPDLEDISKQALEKKDQKSESVWEEHLRKKREKKKAKRTKSKHSSDNKSSDTDTDEEASEQDDFFVKEHSDKSRKKRKNDQDLTDKDEASKAELELLLADDNRGDTGLKGYRIKNHKKGKEIIDEAKIPTAEFNDPRFAALFTSPSYVLDPTDPQFKRSAAYARQVAQKQKKETVKSTAEDNVKFTENNQAASTNPSGLENESLKSESLVQKSGNDKHELTLLVRSLKMKTKQAQQSSLSQKTKKADVQRSKGAHKKQRKLSED